VGIHFTQTNRVAEKEGFLLGGFQESLGETFVPKNLSGDGPKNLQGECITKHISSVGRNISLG
jgi:hypothetical protein